MTTEVSMLNRTLRIIMSMKQLTLGLLLPCRTMWLTKRLTTWEKNTMKAPIMFRTRASAITLLPVMRLTLRLSIVLILCWLTLCSRLASIVISVPPPPTLAVKVPTLGVLQTVILGTLTFTPLVRCPIAVIS